MVDKKRFTVCKDFSTYSIILAKYSIKLFIEMFRDILQCAILVTFDKEKVDLR
jgi:hypothetical protein